MTTSQKPLRVRLACKNVGEFRQKFPNGRTARAFVATDVPREIGLAVGVDFVFADGQVGARGEGVVASKGRLGGRHGIVVQLREIVCPEEEGRDAPSEPAPQRLSHSPIIDDLVEEVLPTGDRDTKASRETPGVSAARRRARWRWPIVAAATSLALTAFLVGVFYGRGSPSQGQADATGARVKAAIAAADDHIAAGRLVGPGSDNALEQLLSARRLDPDNREVGKRLELLSDKFEELADAALRSGDPAEAAAHLQAALNATPGRARLRDKMRQVEGGGAAPLDASVASP